MIDTIDLTLLRHPLKVPYKLAFGNLDAFDTVLAQVSLGGRTGIGEATILTGYTSETIEGTWAQSSAVARTLVGLDEKAAMAVLEIHSASNPFMDCMFRTALDMANRHPVLENRTESRVPLLFGLNPTDAPGIEAALEEAFAAGYGTVKVKVGFDLEKDLARVGVIQRANAGRMKLRIDGNQGFDANDAVGFASAVAPDDVELLEQPCHMDDWQGLAEVAKHGAVPLMLDESIYQTSDIDRAADIGAAFVKLKLMKMGGIDALAAGLKRIKSLGMDPVLGNGVASDIGCWMELCVGRDLIGNAGEMNGFLRPRAPLVSEPLVVVDGAAVLPAGYWPKLAPGAVEEFSRATRHFG